MMDHDAIVELSGAYALNAVAADEAGEVEKHLATCAPCNALVAELRATARLLPLACETVEPSASLKRRILKMAQTDQQAEALLRRNAQVASSSPMSSRRTPARWLSSYWGTAIAAAFLIAAGFGIGTMQARSAALQHMAEMHAQATDAQAQLASVRATNARIAADAKSVHGVVADVAHGRIWDMSGGHGSHWWHCTVVQPPHNKNATLIASIPAAPHGMKYQAWIIRKGTVHRAPVIPPGVAMVEMPMPVEAGDVVAFSMEPPAGSDRPTSPFVMQQTL
jgi:anti-sigma factor RsiW